MRHSINKLIERIEGSSDWKWPLREDLKALTEIITHPHPEESDDIKRLLKTHPRLETLTVFSYFVRYKTADLNTLLERTPPVLNSAALFELASMKDDRGYNGFMYAAGQTLRCFTTFLNYGRLSDDQIFELAKSQAHNGQSALMMVVHPYYIKEMLAHLNNAQIFELAQAEMNGLSTFLILATKGPQYLNFLLNGPNGVRFNDEQISKLLQQRVGGRRVLTILLQEYPIETIDLVLKAISPETKIKLMIEGVTEKFNKEQLVYQWYFFYALRGLNLVDVNEEIQRALKDKKLKRELDAIIQMFVKKHLDGLLTQLRTEAHRQGSLTEYVINVDPNTGNIRSPGETTMYQHLCGSPKKVSNAWWPVFVRRRPVPNKVVEFEMTELSKSSAPRNDR